MKTNPKATVNWWRTAFDEKYLNTYVDYATPAATKKEVAFLMRYLKLTKESSVLDLACGTGRHTLAIAKKVDHVTAFDYSPTLLTELTAHKNFSPEKIEVVRGDMRHLQFDKKFDVVINMFTAWGYFSDEENEQVIAGVARALKKGAVFVLDYCNAYRVIARLGADSKKPIVYTHHLSNGLVVTTEHTVDPLTAQWHMHRTWQERGAKKSYRTAVRLYLAPELCVLLAKHGLRGAKIFGDYDGSQFTADSSRMIVVVKK